jgi:hypothetical protein
MQPLVLNNGGVLGQSETHNNFCSVGEPLAAMASTSATYILSSGFLFVKTRPTATDSIEAIPETTELLHHYPNPFTPGSYIPYQLAVDSEVIVRIYNFTGKLVRTINLGVQKAGYYNSKSRAVIWDGRDEEGKTLPSSLYFYTMKAKPYFAMRRLVLIK